LLGALDFKWLIKSKKDANTAILAAISKICDGS
jgi:hypothetical protein